MKPTICTTCDKEIKRGDIRYPKYPARDKLHRYKDECRACRYPQQTLAIKRKSAKIKRNG